MLSILFSLFITTPSMAAIFYHGEWLQSCTIMNEDDYIQNLVMVDVKLFDLVTFAYEEEGCKNAYLIFKRNYSFNELESVATSETQSTKLKAVVEKVSYTSLTDEVTEALNMIDYCGESDWVTFREKIVTGKNCGDFNVPAQNSTELFTIQSKNDKAIFVNDEATPYNRLIN